MWELLTGHGEDPHHPADPSVAQQNHLHGSRQTLPLLPPGLEGRPDSSQQHQQVEEEHGEHSGDVDSHDEASDWAALELGEQEDIPLQLKNEHTPP